MIIRILKIVGFFSLPRSKTSNPAPDSDPLHAIFHRTSYIIVMSEEAPLFVTNPEAWLAKENGEHDFVCVVFFRGHWCKFDEHYLKMLGEHNKTHMEKERVYLIAWTSEGAEGASKADKEWGLTKDYGYSEVIGDETCALAKYLVEDEILPELVTSTPQEAEVMDHISPDTYPNGLVQPGMVFYAHHGSLACHWEATVDETTMYGATERPLPSEIWKQVLKRKHALDHGNAVKPVCASQLEKCTHARDVKGCTSM
jgi:hypothetical protein